MAPSPRPRRRQRQGLLDTLLEDATEIVQSVVNEVAPGVVGAIDVDDVVQRIDVQALLAKVDVQELLDRVDLDELIDRIDWNAVMTRVDVNALLQRVDIDALIEQTELGTVMTRSTSALVSRTVDVVRSQGVGLDGFVHGCVDRLLRRGVPARPRAPHNRLSTPDAPA